MEKRVIIVLFAATLLVVGCKAKTLSVDSSARSEAVASLRTLDATALERVEVWEKLVMRQDTTGKLVTVSHEIVRHDERCRETTESVDSSRRETAEDESFNSVEKIVQEPRNSVKTGARAFVAGVWVAFAALVVLFVFFLAKKTKLWKLPN